MSVRKSIWITQNTCCRVVLTSWLISGALQLSGAETEIGDHVFTHPDGFEVIRVAGPPLVDRPIEVAFDNQGRLYCTDSAGVNDPVEQQLKERPHQIVRLEDTDGDGVFDERVVFADEMMFPEGCLWYAGSLYVAAPPSIWKLTDTDGDGVADQRTEWFQGQTLTGCANDLHGPYLGPEGWIYWTKGAFAEQHYSQSDGADWVTRAAHIFRARPDGTGLEPVMTGGMDNPVGVTFLPGGERVFTTTFFQHPGGGKRDGLVHAIYGGVYGKDHGVIEGHPRTGGLMPVLSHLGAAAPAGITRYRSSSFGRGFRDNLFSVLFNMQRVMRHELNQAGGTYVSTDSVFLQSNNRNFHPTDVTEDADGSLLVVDTGGWYKLCCPTSQLPKPDVLGGVYRIRKIGSEDVSNPRGEELPWAELDANELLAHLEDPRVAVGDRVVAQLGGLGMATVEAVESFSWRRLSPSGQERLVWALARIDSAGARSLVRSLLAADSVSVRRAAVHATSIHRDREAVPTLLRLLRTDTVGNRRAAAEALGRIGAVAAVPVLLAELGESPGRVYEHSLLYALIEIGDIPSVAAALDSPRESVRTSAMVALAQLNAPELRAEHFVTALNGSAVARRRVVWLLDQQPQHAAALVPSLRQWVMNPQEAGLPREDLVRLLGSLSQEDSIVELIGELMAERAAPIPAQKLLLEVVKSKDPKSLPVSWRTALVQVLESRQPDLLSLAARAAVHFATDQSDRRELLKSVMRLSLDRAVALELRLLALQSVAPHLPALQVEQFEALMEGLGGEQRAAVRAAAQGAVQHVSLSNQQLVQFARSLKRVGPLELAASLRPFGKSQHDRVGRALLAGLQESDSLGALTPASVLDILKDYSEPVRNSAMGLIAKLDVDLAAKRAHLDELLDSLPGGDIRRGQVVFNSEKAACSTCHEIGYLGGDVGPDLTRIGRVRSREDLLEAVVYPSLSFVRSFEPYQVMTEEGDQWNGVIRDENDESIHLVTGPGQSVRLRRDAIAEMSRSAVSLMPQGMDQVLTRQELADLLAFLEATRW